MNLDWGSVPDWLSGTGTILAVVFAGIAARAAILANSHQAKQIAELERQHRDGEREREREQAARIAAWAVPGRELMPQVYFRNGSELPIYSVSVRFHSPVGSAIIRYPVRGPNTSEVTLSRVTTALRDIGEGSELCADDGWSRLLDAGQVTIALSFMDCNGRWWVRDVRGGLVRCGDSAAARAHPDMQAQ